MTYMAKRMLRDRIMDHNSERYDDREYERNEDRYMRDRAMDHMDHRRRGSNGRYIRDRDDENYRDRRDYDDRERYARKEDYGYDYDDGHGSKGGSGKLKLPKEDMERWGNMLRNADGTEGMHFEKRMLRERVKHLDMEPKGFTEEDLFMAANMLYSDYCEVLKNYIPREPEREADFYLKMARAFLEDEDAPDGSAKLAMYFFCIADRED